MNSKVQFSVHKCEEGLSCVRKDVNQQYLSDKDNSEEESVGVDQALALPPGATAAQEGHQEDHTTDDHQEDWSVHIAVAQEVQVVLIDEFSDQYSIVSP